LIDDILSRQMIIALGVAAALLVMIGSGLRIRRRQGKKRSATFFIYIGYTFFALSILLYIVLGFR
jgi:hypothetical protein